MDHFYAIGLRRRKSLIIIIALALFTSLFIWTQRDAVISVFSNEKPTALSKGNEDEPAIALTFNISWGEEEYWTFGST